MALTPQEFVNKWRTATLKERSAAQEHFIDLCRLLGHPTPTEADPAGKEFTFEAGAGKQKGGQGWADVWKRGKFAWEYKGKHAGLTKAYQQLLQYREALENPPLLVVSDLDQAVFAAYGWDYPLPDEEILERLLALNLARAKGQGATSRPAGEAAEESE